MSKPHGFTWIELLAVTALFAVAMALFIPYLAHKHGEASIANCANNLRQLATAFKVYADDHEGCYPPLTRRYRTAPEPGETPWMFLPDERVLIPRYVSNPKIFLCPATPGARSVMSRGGDWVDAADAFDPDRMDDRSYIYSGYACALDLSHTKLPKGYVENVERYLVDDELRFIVEHGIRPWLGNGESVNTQFAWSPRTTEQPGPEMIRGPDGSETYTRLTLFDGASRVFWPDNPGPVRVDINDADLAILWDRPQPNAASPFTHGAGGNVLYMDGHVEYVPYPSKIPMTPAFVNSAALKP